MFSQIQLDLDINKNKPFTNKKEDCPFCNPNNLTNILEKRDDLIWLINKYPVLSNTWPTVIIETLNHNNILATYTKDKLHEVFSFGISRWLKISQNPKFKSTIYFRNEGSESGGSLSHPHSQIIGLCDIDYKECISKKNFEGICFYEDRDCNACISNYPIGSIIEFNIQLKPDGHISKFADTLQTIVQYLQKDFIIPVTSYNLFFYQINHLITAKITPYYKTSPLYRGYQITPILKQKHLHTIYNNIISYFGG